MWYLRAGPVALVAMLLAGCGGSQQVQTQRDAVNAYFARVNAAERPLGRHTTRIDHGFRNFSIGGNTPAEQRLLLEAQTELTTTVRRVRAITPPREARKLHGDLVRLLTLERGVADDLVLTTRFVPALATAVAPLPAASARLSRDLQAAGAPATSHAPQLALGAALDRYAAAFLAYRGALTATLARLAPLHAPLELAPDLTVQRSALRRSAALCTAIATALGKRQIKVANADIHSLFELAGETGPTAARRAETAGKQAYDARLAEIGRLSTKVALARATLVRQVG